ncbi:uncharacterized protein LOC110620768 isoform X2 [Manihot esculenta]|uniref:Uncharacterized protein n=1 Tax=Manihot esculenta TaxID=3983 RepID=A0A2C9VC89_MANES|nr:uncharacterized protein LOC110620768 isoform X2 [Manihot esculenta]OAY42647.1 hypothetical protein MANES_08G004500v8 [Manihot esculenta]
MEFKRRITSIFLLFLLLVMPYISRGVSQVEDSGIYEIDYRGPETHSSARPPPGRSHGRPFFHGDQAAAYKSKAIGENAKKIHG